MRKGRVAPEIRRVERVRFRRVAFAAAWSVDSGTGARVSEILRNSFAAAAGLKSGDTITAVNGKKVNAPNTLEAAVRPLKSGEKVSLQLQREGKPLTLDGVFPEEPRETYAS